MNIGFFGASSDDIETVYLTETEKLGQYLAQQGHNLVYGGGAHGLMGAMARGIKAGGGQVISVAPHIFEKPGILFDQADQMIWTDDLAQRKQKMEALAQAFVIGPGSVGTFDELFDIYAQKKLAYTTKPIIVYNIDGFYNQLLAFLSQVAKRGFMSGEVVDMITVTDDPKIASMAIQSK
jgi:uncharacterized protein (TIGR00730 family)